MSERMSEVNEDLSDSIPHLGAVLEAPTDTPDDVANTDDEQFGGLQEDPYDDRVVNWFGQRLHLEQQDAIRAGWWSQSRSCRGKIER